jgi:predicted transcriptional regulator
MTDDELHQEIIEIKGKLAEMHNDIKRLIERSDHQHVNSLLSYFHDYFSNAIMGYVIEDIETDLERNLVQQCSMKDVCKSNFTEFLKNNASLIIRQEVDEEALSKHQSELEEIRKNAQSDTCDICLSEVTELFKKQVRLMRSLHIYNTEMQREKSILEIPEEFLVKEVLNPLSNKHRFQIFKAVAIEPKTFSELSELTGLRGGNLLSHIRKLLQNGIILQRHEKGDYMITEKGYKILKGLNKMHSMLKSHI